ncbi:MAG: LytR family transcriptional regulator [Ruminococcaceae bacterium]|nr:LytR family transcriptional regulator [Oscillospiraceae bacterium]
MNKYSSEDYEDIYSGREEDDFSFSDEYEDISSGRNDTDSLGTGGASATDYAHLAAQNPRSVYAKETQDTKRVPVRHSGYEDVYSAKPAQQSRYAGKQAPQRRGAKGGKKSKAKKVLAIVLAIVLVLTGIIGFFGFSLLSKINYVPSEHSNLYLDSSKLMSNRRVKNILFIGCDDDSGGSQRSDSIMLVSIDRIHHKFKLTSFMRDTWVYIPDHDYAKLNAAFAYGGAGLLMDTIEYNFGIKIDNYAMVDFDIFSSIIEELGGVEVEVTEAEADFINENTSETVKAGLTKLNGDEALVYCRIRYLDSDFMRTQRQRKVMSAIVEKVKHAGPFTDYHLAEVILPQVKTDITKGEMLGIGLGVFGYLTYDVDQLRIPIDDSYTSEYFGDQQALSIDFEKNKAALREFIYENE